MNKGRYDPERAFEFYPSREEIDRWAERILEESRKRTVTGTILEEVPIVHAFGNGPNALENRFVRFDTPGRRSFYGYWQPALKPVAPLLINLPGYGGYISMHPQINDDNYNILHISPLGYISPAGADMTRAMDDGNWPVLHNTAKGLEGGYEDWLLDCLLAIRWAEEREEVDGGRLSLFGTSQGGGGSLLLGSILGQRVKCVCADLPFLTAFPLSGLEGEAYGILQKAFEEEPEEKFWNRLGYADTLSHAHRLTMPVMLSAGGEDVVCPPETVKRLFEALPGTKQFTFLEHNVHTHSRQSMYLFRNWLALFA